MGKPIDFRPLTQGLGFHPFSDGLPYAPVSKSPQPRAKTTGTGATAAGQPSFSYARPAQPPRVSVPVVSQSPSMVRALTHPLVQKSPVGISAPTVFAEPTFGFTYLVKRIFAYSIDTILNISLLCTGLSFVLLNEDLNPDLLMNPGIAVISVLFFVLFNWALITAQEIAFGTSIGKRIFGLNLQGSTSEIFLRAFFFLPSIGFCGIGLLWGLFDSRRRCWHDVVVNVQPAEVARL